MFLFSGHWRPRPNPKLAGIKHLRLRERECGGCQFARDRDLSRRQYPRLKPSSPLYVVLRLDVPGWFGLSIQFGPPKFSRRSETLPKGDPLPHDKVERLRESLSQRVSIQSWSRRPANRSNHPTLRLLHGRFLLADLSQLDWVAS